MISVESILSLGVGGALGLIIFTIYRMDKMHTEKILCEMVKADRETREDNTKAITELITLLRRLNGNH